MSTTSALRLAGQDALALLHRISTNDLIGLPPGHAKATLFCDFRGRLLHRAVVGVSNAAVWLFRDDAPGASLAAFLDRHVFRDDVRIEDLSEHIPVRRTHGESGITAGTLEERDGVPVAVWLAADEAIAIGGDATPGDPDTLEQERIRAAHPAHGHEIDEAFTPFEVGLAHEVHLDKGCFTGQETLMRLVTYRGVRRRLARVQGPGPPPLLPHDLHADGRPVGVLTSAVVANGGWIGLAVLRLEVCDPPRALEVDGAPIPPPVPLPLTRPLGRP